MKTLLASLTLIFSCSLVVASQTTCTPAKHARLPAITEQTYHRGRARLLKAGWQPYQTIHHNEGTKNVSIRYGNGPAFWKQGYRELEACSGTGLAACAFLFEDAYGNRLRVTTAGEEIPKEKAFARITGYRFVCD